MKVYSGERNGKESASLRRRRNEVRFEFSQPASGQRKWNDLLREFERTCETQSDEVAFYQRVPGSKKGDSHYLALTFGEFRAEYDAWFLRLRSAGVVEGDRVLVALPHGMAWAAACFASLRIGCDLCVLDGNRVDKQLVAVLQPRVLIARSDEARRSKRRLAGIGLIVEVDDPLQRVAKGVSSSAHVSSGERRLRSSVSFSRYAENGSAQVSTLEPDRLSRLSASVRREFGVNAGEAAFGGDGLLRLLGPVWGVSSVYLDDGVSRAVEQAALLDDAVKDLSVRSIYMPADQWNGLVAYADRTGANLEGLECAVVLGEPRQSRVVAEALSARFRTADVVTVFGSDLSPLTGMCVWEDKERIEVGSVGAFPLGRCFEGIRAVIENDGRQEARLGEGVPRHLGVGWLKVAWKSDDDAAAEVSYQKTGYCAFEERDGALWHCGDGSDVVRTACGHFAAARCEGVFEGHPAVKEAYLFPLTLEGNAKAGLLVVTGKEDYPKDAKEYAKLLAELLQLGSQCEETKLIVDIFFSRIRPKAADKEGGVDRRALERKYARRTRMRRLF